MIKGIKLSVLLLFFSLGVFAQRFSFVVFNKLPQDLQLYPRDENNGSKIPISGIFEQNGFDFISVKVFRNGLVDSYIKSPLTYSGSNRGFFSTDVRFRVLFSKG